jgi:tetratricopeptide (TPR) repeat protein
MLQEDDFVADELNEDEESAGGGAPQSGDEPGDDRKSPIANKRSVIKKRRSRKERHEEIGQPDEFVEVGGTIIDWLVERGKVVGIILGIVLIALLAGGIQRKANDGNRAEASSALFQARQLLPTTNTTSLSGGLSFDMPDELAADERTEKTEAAVTSLQAVATDFKGTPQADQARVLGGQALFGIGDFERALAFVEAATEAGGVAGERAQNVQAFALLALNRAPEAVTVFTALRDKSLGESRARATLNLGAAHEAAGDMDSARGIYTLFEEEFPDSALLPEVKSRAGANASP